MVVGEQGLMPQVNTACQHQSENVVIPERHQIWWPDELESLSCSKIEDFVVLTVQKGGRRNKTKVKLDLAPTAKQARVSKVMLMITCNYLLCRSNCGCQANFAEREMGTLLGCALMSRKQLLTVSATSASPAALFRIFSASWISGGGAYKVCLLFRDTWAFKTQR